MPQKFAKALVEKDEGDGILSVAIASDGSMDRMGEVIDQNGWMLEQFRKNPVLLWAHDYGSKPIGKILDIAVVDGRLMFKAQLAVDIYEEAATVYALFKGGYLNAFSVGFNPIEWKSGDGTTEPWRTYIKQELLEISAVPVPANGNALVQARSAGIDLVKLGIADAETFEYQAGLTCEKGAEFAMLKRAGASKDAEITTLKSAADEHEAKMADAGKTISTLQEEIAALKAATPPDGGSSGPVDRESEARLTAAAVRSLAILRQLDASIGDAFRAARARGLIR